VAHRDLKPENVMVDGASLKLMDFGMARPDMVATLASGGLVIGTPAYLAPEQFEGGEVGPACDQYALGVMAFEMLMGELPFKGPSLVRYMVQHTAQVPPVLSRPDVPETLVRAVDRMLAKSAAERFASVDEVLEVMRAVQAS
jgi:serine/threonine-protein kinase